MILQPGTTAPDFEGPISTAETIQLESLKGRKVILAFYPADWSPVCGDQMTLYNEVLPYFKERGAELIGISVDSKWCHDAFRDNRNLHFPLLADFEPKGAVAKAYGVYNEREGQSHRALFVIDEKGKIFWSQTFSDLENPGADGLLGALEEMEVASPSSQLRPSLLDTDHQKGPATASVTLVEFGDFECPHCRHAHFLLDRLLQEMRDDVLFVFRHFPLQEIHPNALTAAMAAEGANRQGHFWPMHDVLFENQKKLGSANIASLAQEIGLDVSQFLTDWKSRDTQNSVIKNFESGMRSGVNGTPAFFINGMKLSGYDGTYESLKDGVRKHIKSVSV